MKLFELDSLSQLPIPSAEVRTIASFKEILERSRPIDGDRDGTKKVLNLKELAYIYFAGTYDSRFKQLRGEDRVKAIKKLLKLPETWIPDEKVLAALNEYRDTQVTESTGLEEVLSESMQSLIAYAKTAQEQMKTAGLTDAAEVNKFLDTLDRIPKTVESLRQVREQLNREHDAMSRGKKGRILNKYELE